MKEKVLILIPVKVNSKRVPKKNLKLLNGIPLWQYAFREAYIFWIKSNNIENKLKVCSESVKIKGYLTSDQFLRRPHYLSEDPYQIAETCLWAIEELKEDFTTLIMVQPSNPFVTCKDIGNCYNLFLEWNRTTVRSVMKLGKTTWRPVDYVYNADENKSQLIITPYSTQAHVGNGSIVVIDIRNFMVDKTLASIKTIPYIMGGVDIDTLQDFILADMLMEKGV